MSALSKDIFRTIKKGKKRFFSIMLITALGVTMLSGLRASSIDLRYSADVLYDSQKLFDIQISSTLGLDDADVEALAALDDITAAEGEFSQKVISEIGGVNEEVLIRTLGHEMNLPTMLEGRLPESANEVAVTDWYLKCSGKKIGDTVTFEEKDLEEDEDPVFPNTELVITGSVIDPFDISNKDGGLSFRTSSEADFTFFVTEDAVDTDIFTAAYVRIAGLEDLVCYDDDYIKSVNQVKYEIDTTLKSVREKERYNTVYGEAMQEYNDAWDEAMTEINDAQSEIDDGWNELNDGRTELEDGKKKLQQEEANANSQIANGRDQIANGYTQLDNGKVELQNAIKELESKQHELIAAFDEVETQRVQTLSQIDGGLSQLYGARESAQGGVSALQGQIDAIYSSGAAEEQADLLAELQGQLGAAQAGVGQIDAQISELQNQRAQAEAGFAAAQRELEDNSAALSIAIEQYELGIEEWERNKNLLDTNKNTLEREAASGKDQIAKAWDDIRDGEAELADGEAELIDGQAELDESKAEAMDELADAKKEIDEIEMTRWYIQSRDALGGYTNLGSDATSVEAMSVFLPTIFFVVAILISLTTITRMVEEERGLIGTYKALGFKNGEIRRKYVIYAALASIIGGIIGDVLGFIGLPSVVLQNYSASYLVPEYYNKFDLFTGSFGIILFLIGILLAVFFAVRNELVQMPAQLMRPLVPTKGSRIFLEYIPGLWKRMSFLNKVTARNIFRYKKRLIMTIVGIMGCTAILVSGFAIRDSVLALVDLQYNKIQSYDVMAVSMPEDNGDLVKLMNDDRIAGWANIRVDNMKVREANGDELTVQMYVIPEETHVENYFKLASADGTDVPLSTDGIMISRSVANVLGLSVGDEVTLQDLSLNECQATVDVLTENYLGDVLYISQGYYEQAYDRIYKPNAVLVNLKDKCTDDDVVAFTDEIGKDDVVISTVSTVGLKNEFAQTSEMLNAVVYLILALSAVLAFVVLFTLSTTNISERQRELATIKVLGFYDREVHSYVNKETIILSIIGIALGVPVGRILSNGLTVSLKIPGLFFAVTIQRNSYIISAIVAFIFAIVVNQITNRLLNKIDPVEALKSVE